MPQQILHVDTLAELGMPDEIVMRHRTPQFSHIFAGDGYSAGYYSYLWSDALTADAAEVQRAKRAHFPPCPPNWKQNPVGCCQCRRKGSNDHDNINTP